jgi:cytosine/adenosine deaminase-related metal-dependent hydrolase
LKHLRIPTDDFTPPGVGPVAYMHLLGLLGRRMICVHCNYISDDDIDTLRGDGATVCYCPRSHHYFYHENHPLTRLLKAGVNVALGTDSMVSNWTLSLLDEMKFVREHYAQIKTGTIFKMATSNGAIALAEDDRLGKIAEGYEADLAAISLSDGEEPALERALAAESKNIFTMIAGEVIFSTGR